MTVLESALEFDEEMAERPINPSARARTARASPAGCAYIGLPPDMSVSDEPARRSACRSAGPTVARPGRKTPGAHARACRSASNPGSDILDRFSERLDPRVVVGPDEPFDPQNPGWYRSSRNAM